MGLVFKLARPSLNFQSGTILPSLQYFFGATVAPGFGPAHLARSVTITHPLGFDAPVESSIQLKYHQDLLSWPRPIRLVLTVPCATFMRPVPTVPVRRPCLARTRPHAGGICDHAPVLMPAHLCPYVPVKLRELALIPL